MNRSTLAVLAAMVTLCVTANADESVEGSISVSQFGRSNIIGFLGRPLGTVVRVTGVTVDGNSTRSRIDAHKTLLEIHTVNGIVLKRPIVFDHPYVRDRSTLPKPGTAFDYFVHESGAFTGIVDVPKGVQSNQPIVANNGFHYHRKLTIHSKNTNQGKTKPK